MRERIKADRNAELKITKKVKPAILI